MSQLWPNTKDSHGDFPPEYVTYLLQEINNYYCVNKLSTTAAKTGAKIVAVAELFVNSVTNVDNTADIAQSPAAGKWLSWVR